MDSFTLPGGGSPQGDTAGDRTKRAIEEYNAAHRYTVFAWTPSGTVVMVKPGFHRHRDATRFVGKPKAQELRVRFGWELFIV